MRALAITQNITLDGRIEMLDDWFDPTGQSPDHLAELHRQDERCDAVLLGRQTFEAFRGYWPEQTGDATGITDQLNRVAKYVVTATLTEPRWQNSTILSGDPIEAVRDLKARDGDDIVVTGSIRLCHSLIAAGIVDEFRLFVYPAVQGRGRPLFPEGSRIPRLESLDAKRFADDVTCLRYRTVT